MHIPLLQLAFGPQGDGLQGSLTGGSGSKKVYSEFAGEVSNLVMTCS